jgi:hypothetical protein
MNFERAQRKTDVLKLHWPQTKNPAVSSWVFDFVKSEVPLKSGRKSLGSDWSCLGDDAFVRLHSILGDRSEQLTELGCLGNVAFKS